MIGRICRCFLKPTTAPSITATASLKQQTISAAEYIQRRINLVTNLRQSTLNNENKPLVVVLRSAVQQFYAPDVPYPFHQCSYFRYFTGLNQSNAVLVILAEPNQQPKAILYQEGRTEKQELWEGPTPKANEIAAISGLEEIKERNQLLFDLQMLTSGAAIVSYDITTLNTIRDGVAEVLSGCSEIVPVREYIDALRWIKSPAEQNVMRQSCRIGSEAMNAVISNSRGVNNENEIVGRLELEVRRRGAASLAYPPVVAAGSRANIIHYLDANKTITDGDTVLVDAGCDYDGYSSDITRVFPKSGHFSEPQRALYEALNDVQFRLLKYLNDTEVLKLNEIYSAMIDYLAANLLEIGMFRSSIEGEELIHEIDKICPHHVSHYLGMDVHDTASVARNIALQPGVIFTVEPGIYIRHDNEKARKEFHGIGMRIEDDVLLRNDGTVEVLTKDAVKDPKKIEQLMSSRRAE